MSRVYIVTGANGHLGRNLIECLLKAEQEVHALILPGEQMPHFPNEYLMDVVEGNVCDIKSMIPLFADTEGKEIVLIHAAAIIDIRSNVSPLTYQVNVVGTKNVVQLALQYRVYRYLHVSSVHAIPEPKVNKLIRETKFFSPQKVHGGYAKTKAEATQLVMDAIQNQGLPGIIVHPSGIIGPDEAGHNNIVAAIKNFVQGKLHICPEGGYNFVDVRDIAHACIKAVDSGRLGEPYILSGRYYRMRDLFDMANTITQEKHRFISVPIWLLKMFAPWMERWAEHKHQAPLITPYSLFALASRANFSHQKASCELGFWPRDMYDTLKDTIRSFTKPKKRVYAWRRKVSFSQ